MQLKHLLYGLLLLAQGVAAQQIHLDLAYHKNKQVTLVATHGLRKDTLQQIVLDANGKGTFNLAGVKKQAGLVGLIIKTSSPPDATFEWIYSPTETPTLVGTGEYVHRQNTQILNSPENQAIDRWAANDYTLKQRQLLLQELLRLYAPTDRAHQTLQNELGIAKKQHNLLLDSIQHANSFAAAFMQFRSNADRYLAQVGLSDSTRNAARDYFRSLDFDRLYHTGMWFSSINPSIEAYIKGGPNYEKFGQDVADNLQRIQQLSAYTDLADATITICEQFSWWNDQNTIVNQLIKDNRIQHPKHPKLQKILAMSRLQAGFKAPDLLLTQIDTKGVANANIMPSDQLSPNKTLLVFHESGCGNCENTLNQLKGNYPDLLKKGWRIISIAADHDASTFQKTAAELPWADKYCDYKGFSGTNFKNYAVMGTPTLYLIDKNGRIISKTATLTEIIQDIQTSNSNKL